MNEKDKDCITDSNIGEESTFQENELNKYEGKIYPLWENSSFYSNPQWYIFAPTFLITLFLVIVFNQIIFSDGYHFYFGRICSIYFLYRFLALAFSEPGLARQRDDIGYFDSYNFCDTCSIPMKNKTRHCTICEVCIDGYDHHCIFVGKCIGKGNICQFYQFLALAFSILIYAFILSVRMTQKT